jgi:hypothetical protein
MANHTYGVSDEDLWGPPLGAAPRVTARLLAEGTPGLHLFAPEFLSLAHRTSVPVLVAHVGSAGDGARVRLADRAIVVAADVTRDVVLVQWDGASGVQLPAPPQLAGEREPSLAAGRAVESLSFELGGHPGVGWLPGKVALTVIVGDQSARRTITIGETVRAHDTGVDEALQRDALAWPPAGDGGQPPAYTRFAESPAVPEAPGIALAASPVVLPQQGARAMVFASFRVAPQARPRHTVPITLVITGAKSPAPHVLRMRVPSDDTVTGWFAIDLLSLVPLVVDDTYFVYAFSGESMSPLARITLVSEARAALSQPSYGYQPMASNR